MKSSVAEDGVRGGPGGRGGSLSRGEGTESSTEGGLIAFLEVFVLDGERGGEEKSGEEKSDGGEEEDHDGREGRKGRGLGALAVGSRWLEDRKEGKKEVASSTISRRAEFG